MPPRAQDDILGGWQGEGGKVEGAANKKMEGIHEDEYGAEERGTAMKKGAAKKTTQFTKMDHELRSRMDNTSSGFLSETLILTKVDLLAFPITFWPQKLLTTHLR